jgi:hypothetical protein
MWTLNRGAAAWAAGRENEAAVLGSAFRTAHSRARHQLPPQMSECARFSGQFIPIARRGGIQTHRKAGSVSTENLNSEMQNRQRGAAQSQGWQRPDGSSASSAAGSLLVEAAAEGGNSQQARLRNKYSSQLSFIFERFGLDL